MRDEFRDWMLAEGYVTTVISSRISNLRRVERDLGRSLDAVITEGGLARLVGSMVYTKEDERRNRPNPSVFPIKGNIFNGLQTLKSAVTLYAAFKGANWSAQAPRRPASALPHGDFPEVPRDDTLDDPRDDPPDLRPDRRFSYEDDLQAAVRSELAVLEPGLEIIDGGRERQVASGRIDILARDALGSTVVVELRAGRADARVIGQTLGHMSDIAAQDGGAVRGIIVARDFDQGTRAAARAVPNLSLVRYVVTFRFAPEP